MTSSKTLQQALDETTQKRWRKSPSSRSQAIKAAETLARVISGPDQPIEVSLRVLVEDIGDRDTQQATQVWYSEGLSPATINKRLSCLSAMGVAIGGYEKDPPKLKWWLTPDEERRAHAYMEDNKLAWPILSHYIAWSTKTGLRVEETLRTRREHFSEGRTVLLVPGTKTATSQASLFLCDDAVMIANAQFELHPTADRLFDITYDQLHALWETLREAMGWTGHGVTLKALRRSAARFLHVDRKMPLDMVRQYLRHEDIETTMGYLRLTGGYSLEEQRNFLR